LRRQQCLNARARAPTLPGLEVAPYFNPRADLQNTPHKNYAGAPGYCSARRTAVALVPALVCSPELIPI
jgi:hypothetical protein